MPEKKKKVCGKITGILRRWPTILLQTSSREIYLPKQKIEQSLVRSSSSLPYLWNGRSTCESSMLTALNGCDGLLAPLRSPLPVLRSAWRIVSTISSPPSGGLCVPCEVGLPGIRAAFEMSMPLTEGAPLVGGDGPNPCEDAGERIGDGDRFVVEERLMCISLLFSTCSA